MTRAAVLGTCLAVLQCSILSLLPAQDLAKFGPGGRFQLEYSKDGFGIRSHGVNETLASGDFIAGPGGVLLTQPRIASSLFTVNNARWLFGPRAGIAWDPFSSGRTSVRAGFGLAYNLLDDVGFCCLSTNPAFSSLQFTNPGFPFQIDPQLGIPASLLSSATPSGGGIQPDAHTPAVLNYRVEIEREIASGTSLRLAWIGSHGYNALTEASQNLNVPIVCSVAGDCPASLGAGAIYYPAGAVRANPALGTATQIWSSGISNYNAAVIDLNRKFRSGIGIRANYTRAKSLDDSSNLASGQATNNPSTLLDPARPLLDYGPSAFDIRNRIAVSASVQLPFGRGRKWLSAHGRAVNALVSAWQLNLIAASQSGFPFTPELGFNQSRDGDTSNPDRPDWAPGRTPANAVIGSPQEWFDPAAFVLPLAGTYGDVARNSLTGPRLNDVDASLFRMIAVTEKLSLQMRAEVFNLANHTNFALPSNIALTTSGAPASSAGLISATATDARELQFGLKLLW